MARISTYKKDKNIYKLDLLAGTSYEGLDARGSRIYKTRSYKIEDLANYFSMVFDPEKVSLNLHSFSANFGVFDENWNLISMSQAFADQVLQVTASERYANALFVTNLATSVGTFDDDGNLLSLSEAFANQVLSTTSSDKFATSEFATNLATSFGTYNADGSIATFSESFADQVLSTANTSEFAQAQFVSNLASSLGTTDTEGNLTVSEAFANQVLNTETTTSYAESSFVTNLASSIGATDENGNILSLSEAFANSVLNTETTTDYASSQSVNTLTAQFGTYDPVTDTFTFSSDATYFEQVKNYADVDSATASKLTNLNSTLSILDDDGEALYTNAEYLSNINTYVDTNSASAKIARGLNTEFGITDDDGNIVKTKSEFDEEVSQYVDANSATASKITNLNATLDILNEDGTIKKTSADFLSDIRADVDANSATASKAESLRVEIEGQDGTGGLTASVTQTQQAVAAKPDIFRQTTAPSTDNPLNSVWYDTDDSNKPYILIGDPKTWTETTDERVGEIINNVSASYGLEVDANGNIASMKLLADGTSGSSIVFNADTFKVYNGSTSETPFEVVGGVVKIKSANIGSVSFGSLSDVPDTFITTVIYATDANGTSPSTTKGTRNFVAFYNSASEWNDGDTLPSGLTFTQIRGDDGADGADGAQGPIGPAGQDGVDGINGTNGVDGTDGVPGVDGDSANVVVSNATTAQCPNGGKVYEFYVGTTLIDTQIVCNGVNGADGTDGVNGTNGADGADGAAGIRITTGIIWYNLGSSTAPATPSSSGITFNFNNGTFSSLPTNWSVEPPQMEAGTASNKYWTSRYQVIESSSGSGSGTPSFFTPIRAFAFDQVVTFSSLGTAGSTTIDGGNITTGFIRSNNWDAPDAGETFADAGTALYLNSGAIISKNFLIDSSGNSKFKGDITLFDGATEKVSIKPTTVSLTTDTASITHSTMTDASGSYNAGGFNGEATGGFSKTSSTVTSGNFTIEPGSVTIAIPYPGTESIAGYNRWSAVGVGFDYVNWETEQVLNVTLQTSTGTNVSSTSVQVFYHKDTSNQTSDATSFYYHPQIPNGVGVAVFSGLAAGDYRIRVSYTRRCITYQRYDSGYSTQITNTYALYGSASYFGTIQTVSAEEKISIGTNGMIATSPGGFAKVGQVAGNYSGHFLGDFKVDGVIEASAIDLSSDERLKMDIHDISDPLTTITNLNPKTFKWNKSKIDTWGNINDSSMGFIAQEVEVVLPDLVRRTQSNEFEDGVMSLDYTAFIALNTAAVKKLLEKIEQLESRIAELET